MEDGIKELLQAFPGLSANRILKHMQNRCERTIFANHLYKCLRMLKKQGILINKGNRWYVNTKHQSICLEKGYSGGKVHDLSISARGKSALRDSMRSATINR